MHGSAALLSRTLGLVGDFGNQQKDQTDRNQYDRTQCYYGQDPTHHRCPFLTEHPPASTGFKIGVVVPLIRTPSYSGSVIADPQIQ